MGLPTIDTYAFPVVLPSSNTTISMRPFLVREEKLLLMARESKSIQEQTEAVAQVIRNCTNNQIDPKKVSYFDIEYLLLQIRARSIGEIVNPIYRCNMPLSENPESECGHETTLNINLAEISVSQLKDPSEMILKLSPKYTLRLRYPTIYTINELLSIASNSSEAKTEKSIDTLTDLFDVLIDNDTNTTYNFSDYSLADKIDFMDQLVAHDYEKILSFINDMPTVKYDTTYMCGKCGTEHKVTLMGVSDFLM